MNLSRLLASALLSAGLLLCASARASDAVVDFDDMPASATGQIVDINLPPSLLAVASQFVEKSDHDTAELIRHLKLVRVNVVKLGDSNRAQALDHIRRVRESLKDWRTIVSVRQPNGDNVDISMKSRGNDLIEGFVITVIRPNGDAVFVNVVGDITPAQLGMIASRLSIPGIQNLELPAHT